MPSTRPRRGTLHIQPNAVRAEEDSIVSSSAITTDSPVTPLVSPSSDTNDDGNLSAGSDSNPSGRSREKRKRSRVTPEQLIHLERFFAVDRSPTAARRREISDLLGMQERQTQIWFQNRRAKAKMLDGKARDRASTDLDMSVSCDVDLHNIIHEDDAVTFIPCTALSVGTWRRIASAVSKHDLVAYVCESKQALAWFILSGGNGFKMEIPFNRIIGTEFTHTSSGVAHVVFNLSEPPIFYLEYPTVPRPDGSMKLSWRQCSDWTEGNQATQVLRHDLLGSAPQLSHLVHQLKLSRADGNIPLISTSYKGELISSLEIPAPPLAGLLGPSSHSSHYGSPSSDEVDTRLGIIPDTGQAHQSTNFEYNPHIPDSPALSSVYDDILDQRLERYSNTLHQPRTNILTGVPVSRLSAARPFSATSDAFPSMYPDDVNIAQSLQNPRRHTWANIPVYSPPSPPLLTTSFYPATDFIY
ncbi:hypothetical protein BDP27DRAFT_929857 [Rhodocollybia butyracea]|uniref:Homeobox domain-containing protein n=1 Tax=Rhodocollybia butyracea TaxID=206335 RepID=A0A9P5PRH3_9AGAR|nr:hypothetical protein BDP27DRAFT_929857 [Rhodocollybia butyracea]